MCARVLVVLQTLSGVWPELSDADSCSAASPGLSSKGQGRDTEPAFASSPDKTALVCGRLWNHKEPGHSASCSHHSASSAHGKAAGRGGRTCDRTRLAGSLVVGGRGVGLEVHDEGIGMRETAPAHPGFI